MEIYQAIILGIVQGVAEFLPISSSGHLLILQTLFDIREPGVKFEIVVHLGSLCAVIAVFWRDIIELILDPFQKYVRLLIIGTIPAVIVGFLFRDYIDEIFSQALYLALAFIFTGVLLILADNITRVYKRERDITYFDALLVGCMQAVALPPGISRSGATITGGLVVGMRREVAARFSFMLSIIIITAAGTLEAFELREANFQIDDIAHLMVGFFAAAITGYISIRLLLRLITKAKLKYFSLYLFILAALILADGFWFNFFF